MSFSAQIAGFGERTTRRVQEVRRGVSLKLFNSVILDTPVKTGRARGNWQVSTDKPIVGEISREDASGRAVMAEVEAEVKKSDGDAPLFLSNSLPYIQKLEEGGSKQAPEGMVRRNVVRFGRLVAIEVANKKE